MKNYVAICLLSLMVSGCAKTLEPSMERMVDDALNRAVEQYKYMYSVMDSIPEMLPRSIDKNGALETSDSYFWTSGFIPGLFGICMNIPEMSSSRRWLPR